MPFKISGKDLCGYCSWWFIRITQVFTLFFLLSTNVQGQFSRSVTVEKTYTSSGNFTITDLVTDIPDFDPTSEIFAVANVDILLVGGGGGAGRGGNAGGGGGGEVLIESIDLNLGATISINIGNGGLGARQGVNNSNNGNPGGDTMITLISGSTTVTQTANGGLAGRANGIGGDSGNGNAGGTLNGSGQNSKGGGGGGAGGPGNSGSGSGVSSTGGEGGEGVLVSIVSNTYGAGGGGNGRNGGSGGNGIGGNANPNGAGGNGSPFTGSGGGAGRANNVGGNGADGIVIVQIIYRILPVEFANFTAQFSQKSRSSKLDWSTAKEWENSHFDIERSINDITSWEKIGEVEGQGYSDELVEYSYEDKDLPISGGNIFYRLKQNDFNGDFAYSNTKAVKVDPIPGSTFWRAYPNPTNGSNLKIELLNESAYQDEIIYLSIISGTGDTIFSEATDFYSLAETVSQVLSTKNAGLYYVQIIWGNNYETHKILVNL